MSQVKRSVPRRLDTIQTYRVMSWMEQNRARIAGLRPHQVGKAVKKEIGIDLIPDTAGRLLRHLAIEYKKGGVEGAALSNTLLKRMARQESRMTRLEDQLRALADKLGEELPEWDDDPGGYEDDDPQAAGENGQPPTQAGGPERLPGF